jgi:hypothetical protein
MYEGEGVVVGVTGELSAQAAHSEHSEHQHHPSSHSQVIGIQ